MADRIVIDTGPLIALARAEAIDVASRLPFDFVAPPEVRQELEAGAAVGHAPVDVSFVRFTTRAAPLHPLALATLGRGEVAVIQLALDERIRLVCLDERRGRTAAAATGLVVTGTLGLLGRAKNLGLVGAVAPYIRRMSAAGEWFDEALVDRVLCELGEVETPDSGEA